MAGRGDLEPNALGTNLRSFDTEIQLSIAISLKRIADVMEKASKVPVMAGMSEEEYQRWYSNHPGSLISPYIVNKP